MNRAASSSPAAARADDFLAHAHAFASVHAERPTQPFADNLDSRVTMLEVGGLLLPASCNDGEPDNAWVCSPRTAYGAYAMEEAQRYAPAALAPGLAALARALDGCLRRARIDRAVAVNNWLLSTNLYPPLAALPLPALLAQALARWPDHALWLRSLNDRQHPDWLAALGALGFELLPSRQVYLFEDLAGQARERHNLRIDLRLAARQAGRMRNADVGPGDYQRIAHLYRRLYVDKYSRHNPHYTAEFMRRWHQAGLLEFDGFRDEAGELLCATGQFRLGGVLTTPVVGYEIGLPQRLGLYRLATACTFEHALAEGATINFSAGAAEFKRLRGGRASIEYSAVYARHLPRPRRRAIAALGALARRVGVPIMRRYRL